MNDSDLGYDLEWEDTPVVKAPVVVLIEQMEQEENELEFA
jgi:hypothetical protein